MSRQVEAIAKRAAEKCRKGDVVIVEGTLETRRWEVEGKGFQYITEVAIRPFIGGIRRMPVGVRKGDEAAMPLDDPFEDMPDVGPVGDGSFSI